MLEPKRYSYKIVTIYEWTIREAYEEIETLVVYISETKLDFYH